MNLKDRANKLRVLIIKNSYNPNSFAEKFLDTPSARWEEDGVYNLAFKYSDKVLVNFLENVEEYLSQNGVE